ncbi:MAG TPA: 23S rRNA (uracil(1939)-C(5))-methyltransferase RlmD [Gammaproteobacteria bacterium]|nr:23S rRNA (uracil(1939)-C(5))-methyltransferase RlmD [Gammaproteobacteria bacterium]
MASIQTTTIERLGGDGAGLGRTPDGRILVLPGALPGERVSYTLRRERSRHAEGRLEAVLERAPQRVEPLCPHFGACGGCKLQHLDPAAQLEAKQDQVLSTLARLARLEPAHVSAPIAGDPWGYRRRARLSVKYLPGQQRVVVGFRAESSARIAALAHCNTLVPAVGTRLDAIAELIASLDIRERIPQIEVAAGDNAVALVLRVLDPPSTNDCKKLAAFGCGHNLWVYLQTGGTDSVAPLDPAAPALYYDLPHHDIRVYFEPIDFIQVNGAVNAALVDAVVELLDPATDETVLDLFSGLGNFSLPLARRAGQVVAVEGGAAAVARGRANAAANGLSNVDFVQADLFADQRRAGWLTGKIDVVVLDPPRSGAREILPLVAARHPRRIVYVSCHPATLARDAAELVQRLDYRLSAAGVADMFPHTNHVESIAVFDAK